MRTFAGVVALWLTITGLTLGAAEDTILHAYPLGFADMDAASEAVRAVIGETGKIIPDKSHGMLMVVTTPTLHKLVKELMDQLNVPPKNVRIDVQFRSRSEQHEAGASATGSGRVVIEEGKRTSTKIRIKPEVTDQSSAETANTTQSLLVMSGQEAFLRIGESVPYLDWLVGYGLQRGYMDSEVKWQEVGSFLVVQPTVIGDGPNVRVRLIPELRGLVDGNPYRVRYANVTTEVIVRDGQKFSLGGLSQDKDFSSRFLVGGEGGRSTQSTEIWLTPHITDGAAAIPAPR